jgi:hypothetical protein
VLVFVEDAAESIASSDVELVELLRFGDRFEAFGPDGA